nr:hypothetical protein CFP56_38682 [Quercus suber]
MDQGLSDEGFHPFVGSPQAEEASLLTRHIKGLKVTICWALVIAATAAAYHVLCYGGKLPKLAVQELLDVIDWDPDTGAILFDPLTYVIVEGLSDESSYPFVGTLGGREPCNINYRMGIFGGSYSFPV